MGQGTYHTSLEPPQKDRRGRRVGDRKSVDGEQLLDLCDSPVVVRLSSWKDHSRLTVILRPVRFLVASSSLYRLMFSRIKLKVTA
jgi:hypothetical protein